MSADLAELTRLRDEIEQVMLDALGAFIKSHPSADSARFAIGVFVALAGRVGISHLDAEITARFMEDTAAAVRSHGKSRKEAH